MKKNLDRVPLAQVSNGLMIDVRPQEGLGCLGMKYYRILNYLILRALAMALVSSGPMFGRSSVRPAMRRGFHANYTNYRAVGHGQRFLASKVRWL